MNNSALLNERRLNNLRLILENSSNLSFEEIEEITYRARTLLEKCPQVVGIEGLIKRINAFKKRDLVPYSFDSIYNHINELNLIHFFAVNKRMAVAVERKARTDNNKRIDIIINSEKTYYLEVKNLNKPKLTPKEFDFLRHVKEMLGVYQFREPYLIHINIFDHKRLKFKNCHLDFILERLAYHKESTHKQLATDKSTFWFFPDKNSPIFSFAFIFKPEFPYLDLESYSMNSNRLDFSIKKRIIEGIKDAEAKFLDSGQGHVNILAIPIGTYDFESAVSEIQHWYYGFPSLANQKKNDHPEADLILEHYDIYSKIIDFSKKGKIDIIVTVTGRGLLENYSWNLFPPDSSLRKEVTRLFETD